MCIGVENLDTIGLALLLVAWGADYFWRSKASENLKSLEYIILNQGVTDNRADLQFLKYLMSGRNEPKFLAKYHKISLEGLIGTSGILKRLSVKVEENVYSLDIIELYEFVRNKDAKNESLDPNDIQRDVQDEIAEHRSILQKAVLLHLERSTGRLKWWGRIFAGFYVVGTSLLIIGGYVSP